MTRLVLRVGLTLMLQLQLGASFKLVCYFTSWAQYRPGPALVFPKDLDPHLCTHLVYAFASMHNNRIIPGEKDDEKEIYPQLIKLKERNKELRTLLSIGGWNFGTSRFTTMLSTRENRKSFISSVIDFLRKHSFDGLDLFFQYPTFRGSPFQDRDRFSFLIRELLLAFRKESKATRKRRLLVTAAVSGDYHIINLAYDVAYIGSILDYISVLTFDFHGSWDMVTGHNSPLYGSSWKRKQGDYLNCEFAMKLWEEKGAPREKLIMGFPTYGRTFDILSSNKGVGAPAFGPASPGNYTQESGLWAYYEICPFLKKATVKWVDQQRVPYAYKKNDWLSYDDTHSFAYKAWFIREKQYGGAMVWSLDLDDFRGSFCGQGRFPLVNTLKDLLTESKFHSTLPPPTNLQIPLDVSTLTPQRKTSPHQEMPGPLTTTPYNLEVTPTSYRNSSTQNIHKLNFITQWLKKTSSAPRYTTVPPVGSTPSQSIHTLKASTQVPLKKTSSAPRYTSVPPVGSTPPQDTHTLKASTQVPGNPTILHVDRKSPPTGSTVPSHNFPISKPVPPTTNRNTSL